MPEKRAAIAHTMHTLLRQEATLRWLLGGGVPEAVLGLAPELPNLLNDLDHAPPEAQQQLIDKLGFTKDGDDAVIDGHISAHQVRTPSSQPCTTPKPRTSLLAPAC